MFNIIIVVFLFVLGVLGYNTPIVLVQNVGIGSMTLSLIWLFTSQINGCVEHSYQTRRFEQLRAKLKKLENHKAMTKGLVGEFKKYLGEKYPNMEMEFFKKSIDNESQIILAYPELQSHKTLTKLVDTINRLTNETNIKLGNIEEYCADIRFERENKWHIIKPQIPADILPHL